MSASIDPASIDPASIDPGIGTPVDTACRSCGLPQARSWHTPDGPVRLCPPCATLHGLGCP